MQGIRKLLVFMLITFIVSGAFAQKQLNEATLTYAINVESIDGKPELAKAFEGAQLIVYLKGNQSRSDMQSTLGVESSIYDSKTGAGAILKEYSGQKLMITMDKENWNQKNLQYHNAVFKIEPKEEIIGGFKAKKAVGTFPDGKTIVIYFTPEYIPANKQYNNAFTQLPGIPVRYEVQSGNIRFTYQLIKIDQEIIPSAKFLIPKTGYRVMTFDENQQLKKGDKK